MYEIVIQNSILTAPSLFRGTGKLLERETVQVDLLWSKVLCLHNRCNSLFCVDVLGLVKMPAVDKCLGHAHHHFRWV